MLHFFLGQALKIATIAARFQVAQIANTRLNGLEVGEHTTEPALVDIVHSAAFGLFGHRFLGLFLGADKQDASHH